MKKKVLLFLSTVILAMSLVGGTALAEGYDSPDSDGAAIDDGAAGDNSAAGGNGSATNGGSSATSTSTRSPRTGVDVIALAGFTAVFVAGAGISIVQIRKQQVR